MSDIESGSDSEIELHPFVEDNIHAFDRLVELQDEIKETQTRLSALKKEQKEIEEELSEAFNSLGDEAPFEKIVYKTVKVDYRQQTVIKISKTKPQKKAPAKKEVYKNQKKGKK